MGEWVGVYTQAEERVILYRLSSEDDGGLERQDLRRPIAQFGVGRVILSVSAHTFLLGVIKECFNLMTKTSRKSDYFGFLDCTGLGASSR